MWDAAGNVVKLLEDLPLDENVSPEFDAVRPGRRAFDWRNDEPATVVWAEATDGGDPAQPASTRDHVMLLAAPFAGEPRLLAELEMRYRGVVWSAEGMALLRERWWKNRCERVWMLRPEQDGWSREILFERSFEDRYNDPGFPLLRRCANGRRLLLTGHGKQHIYLAGEGASDEGNRPFLDQFDLDTRQSTRLWQSEPPWYESTVAFLDDSFERLLTRRESVSEPPNFIIRDLAGQSSATITSFPHPTPQLQHVQKRLLRYARADGVMCTASLYTPQGYTPADGPLPTLVWAYPTEFKSRRRRGAGDPLAPPFRTRRGAHAAVVADAGLRDPRRTHAAHRG